MSSTPTEVDQIPPGVRLHQLLSGYFVSFALHAAAELGVADELTDGPRDVDEVAKRVGADSNSLFRVLRALASVGVFTETAPRHFALTPVGACLRTAVPGSLRALSRFVGHIDHAPWGHVVHAVRTGQTGSQHLYGMGIFAHMEQHPEKFQIFNEAMTDYVSRSIAAVVDAYDVSRFHRIVDVGGGHGALLEAILVRSPQISAVLFDLPHVVTGAQKRLDHAGVGHRCEFVGGDFFESVPEGGDAYLLASIVHDWEDDRAELILANCRRAMAPGATLLVVETVIPSGDTPHFGKVLDLEMLVVFGGRERSEAEYRELLDGGGFTLTRVVPTQAAPSVIEAVRR